MSSLGVPGIGLVTGGGSGIGRAAALLLAKEGAAGIALADVNKEGMETVKAELEAVASHEKFKCITIVVDVRNTSSVKSMVAETAKVFGRLDYAVNCAGIGFKKAFAETESEDWDRMIAINLTGVFNSVKEETLQMMSQEPLTTT